MILGIDPGWASFGGSIEHKGKIIGITSFVPRDLSSTDSISKVVEQLEGWIERVSGGYIFGQKTADGIKSIEACFIERFVAYAGIHSDMSEKILMLIGALKYAFERENIPVHMVRAIDWKPTVCKYLVRTKNFNNPYPAFDKQYSILAAKTLSGLDLKSDHEADAICMSYLGKVNEYNASRVK